MPATADAGPAQGMASDDSTASPSPLHGDGYRRRAATVYQAYGPVVYRRCLRLLGDRDAAREAAREIFVKLLRDLEELQDPDRALRRAYRAATSHCLTLQRNGRAVTRDVLRRRTC